MGPTPEYCKNMCIKLEKPRVGFADLSTGSAFKHKKESTKAREAYFIKFTEMIRPHLSQAKIYCGGMNTTPSMV